METQNDKTTNTQSAGDIMQKSHQEAIRRIVIFAGIAVYLAGIAYAETHALNVLSQGVNPDFLVWAYIGMIALGITAVVLPLALHFWAFEAMHRIAAFAFYAVDLLLLGINSFVDFSVNTGETLAPWAQNYFDYVLPSTPVIAAVGWSVLFLLDPAARAHILGETLRASIREALSKQIVEAAKGENVNQVVNAAARAEVDKSLTDLFGRPVVVDRRRHELTTADMQFNLETEDMPIEEWEQLENELREKGYLKSSNLPHPTDAGSGTGSDEAARKAAAKAEAKAFGMWDPNDPNDTPFERSRPDVHQALIQAAKTDQAAKYGPAWEDSTNISIHLDGYAWVCLHCEGHNAAHTPKCQYCQQPRTNGSPTTAFANIPPASSSKEDTPDQGAPFPGE